jgi:ketosteroid isomerase-like protein
MSDESATPDLVEVVRGLSEAVNRRDVDAIMHFYAPDAIVDMTRTIGLTHRGHAALRAFFADWSGAFEEAEAVFEEVVDLGSGVVFSVYLQHGRPVGSTGHVRQRDGVVTVWVEGLIGSQVWWGQDIEEARGAAGRLALERG